MRQLIQSYVVPMKILVLFSLAIVLLSCQGQAQASDQPAEADNAVAQSTRTDISVEEFKAGIERENIQILDVRTQDEYNSGHIAGSFLADWTEPDVFAERIKSLDKNKPVYTYCLSGARSRSAAIQLRREGFKEVYNLAGGVIAWSRAAMPLQGVQKAQQMTMAEFRAQIPAGQTVLVDIGAVWCPPCKKMEPVVKDLVESNGSAFKFVQVDGGVQEDLVKELGANSFPTFIIYKGGKEVWRKEGIVSKEELKKQLL